jgi:hypothetical protein
VLGPKRGPPREKGDAQLTNKQTNGSHTLPCRIRPFSLGLSFHDSAPPFLRGLAVSCWGVIPQIYGGFGALGTTRPGLLSVPTSLIFGIQAYISSPLVRVWGDNVDKTNRFVTLLPILTMEKIYYRPTTPPLFASVDCSLVFLVGNAFCGCVLRGPRVSG